METTLIEDPLKSVASYLPLSPAGPAPEAQVASFS